MYDAVRRPFAQDVQRRSAANGRLYHLNREGWESISAEESAAGKYTPENLKAVADALGVASQWAVIGSAMDEKEKALRLLEAELGKARC